MNTFKTSEYRRWRAVPSGVRLRYGLIAGAITALAFLILSSVESHAWTVITLLTVTLLIAVPISEYYTEKLKREYNKEK